MMWTGLFLMIISMLMAGHPKIWIWIPKKNINRKTNL